MDTIRSSRKGGIEGFLDRGRFLPAVEALIGNCSPVPLESEMVSIPFSKLM